MKKHKEGNERDIDITKDYGDLRKIIDETKNEKFIKIYESWQKRQRCNKKLRRCTKIDEENKDVTKNYEDIRKLTKETKMW